MMRLGARHRGKHRTKESDQSVTHTRTSSIYTSKWHNNTGRWIPVGLVSRRWRSLDLPSRRRHRFCCYARSLPTPHTKHTPHHQRFDSLPADHGDFEHRTPLTHHTNATGARFAGVRRFCGLCGSHPRLCFFFRSSLFFLFWAAQPCCEFRCFPSLGIHRARAATIKPHLDYYGGP